MRNIAAAVLIALTLWFVLPVAYAVKVESSDVFIESKDTFHCLPIYNEKGDCLIRAYADVKVSQNKKVDIEIKYKDKDKFVFTEKDTKFQNADKKDKDKADKDLQKDKLTRVYFDFWTATDGKFDVVVDGIVLDPFFNVTINTTTPSYHLLNGTIDGADDNNFNTLTDITAGLSDSSDATTFTTTDSFCSGTPTACTTYVSNATCSGQDGCTWGTGSIPTDWLYRLTFDNTYISDNGKFPNTQTGTSFKSIATPSGYNYAVLVNSSDQLIYNSTYPDGIKFYNDTEMSWSFWIRTTTANPCNDGTFHDIWDMSGGSNGNIFVQFTTDNLRARVDGLGAEVTASTTSCQTWGTNQWHHITATWNSSVARVRLYTDGILRHTATGSAGKLSTPDSDVDIGHDGGSSQANVFLISDAIVYKRVLSDSEVLAINNSYPSCSGTATTCPSFDSDELSCEGQDGCSFTTAKAIRPYFNYTVENRSWLRVRKTTTGVDQFRVYSYINSSQINTTNFIDYSITTGWDIIPLAGLVGAGYNNPFRIYSTTTAENISEVQFIVEEFVAGNETNPPNITSCLLNNSNLGCTDSIRFQCDVVDDSQIDKVWFNTSDIVNNVSEADKIINTSTYYIDRSYDYDGFFSGSFAWVNATDQFGNFNFTQLDIPFTYNCSFEDYINISHNGIDGVDQINLTTTSVVIQWETSNPSDSLIEYGLNPGTLNISVFNAAYVTTHSVPLSSLIPNTTYFYSVTSSFNPNQTLTGFNFTTLHIPDATAPQVTNCAVNSTVLLCNDTLRMTCDVVEPDSTISSVVFNWIDNATHTEGASLLSGDTYYIDQTYSSSEIFNGSFLFANATNLDGYYNETSVNLQFNYTCCIEDWVQQTEDSVCFYQNSTLQRTLFYTDSRDCGTTISLPGDNGTVTTHNCTGVSQTLETGQCPTTTSGVMTLFIFVVIALFFIGVGFFNYSSIAGLFGAFMLTALSWILAGCSAFLAFIIGLTGLVLIVYFVVRKTPIHR